MEEEKPPERYISMPSSSDIASKLRNISTRPLVREETDLEKIDKLMENDGWTKKTDEHECGPLKATPSNSNIWEKKVFDMNEVLVRNRNGTLAPDKIDENKLHRKIMSGFSRRKRKEL